MLRKLYKENLKYGLDIKCEETEYFVGGKSTKWKTQHSHAVPELQVPWDSHTSRRRKCIGNNGEDWKSIDNCTRYNLEQEHYQIHKNPMYKFTVADERISTYGAVVVWKMIRKTAKKK